MAVPLKCGFLAACTMEATSPSQFSFLIAVSGPYRHWFGGRQACRRHHAAIRRTANEYHGKKSNISAWNKWMNAQEIARALGGAKRTGSGWDARCPAHKDNNPSLSLTDGNDGTLLFHCHAGCEQEAVLDALKRRELWNVNGTRPPARRKSVPWTPVMPVPDSAPRTIPSHRFGKPSRKWCYRDKAGNLFFLICRFDNPDGKEILPLTFCENAKGHRKWCWKACTTMRPMYNLDVLSSRPDAPVVVVEGEKAADAAAELLPDFVVTTSSGGCKAASKTDWLPLKNRNVIIWPDADDCGAKYAEEVAQHCRNVGVATVRIIKPPSGVSSSWDAADAHGEWTPEQILELVNDGAKPDVATFAKDADVSNVKVYASTVVTLARQANLSGIALGSVLKTAKERSGIGVTELRQAFKQGTPSADDLGLAVALKTLDNHYDRGDHLIRAVDKCFYVYTGTHWRRATDEQIRKRLLNVVEIIGPRLNFATVVDSAFKLIVAKQAADGDTLRLLSEPPPVVNCRNGELWLENGDAELRPHRHDSFLTSVLDVDYDVEAECPEFDEALRGIFRDSGDVDDMVRHVHEFIGYAIQPGRFTASWFMLYGGGNNGKTKFTETMQRLMGLNAVTATRIDTVESNKFALGSLVGKLMLIDDDVDARTKIPDGFLKKISERKTMSAEHKFKDQFEFVACCLPVLLANNWPRCDDLSNGTRRRAHIIPFTREFIPGKDDDTKLFDRIWKNELSGVLNRAVEGLHRLQQRGRFLDPEACTVAKGKWMKSANPLMAFLEDGCFHDPAERVTLTIFYRLYKQWADESGVRFIEARNTIKDRLESLGYNTERGHGNQNLVVGVRPHDG
jgi:P4 family phage/plasmid primase-like protien